VQAPGNNCQGGAPAGAKGPWHADFIVSPLQGSICTTHRPRADAAPGLLSSRPFGAIGFSFIDPRLRPEATLFYPFGRGFYDSVTTFADHQ